MIPDNLNLFRRLQSSSLLIGVLIHMGKDLKDNNLYKKAYDFAVKIIRLYQKLCSEKKEYVLSKQLLRSGTSIGANIAEAYGGISKADFSAKLSISYKECLETKYWLNLLKDTKYIPNEIFDIAYEKADEIAKILYTIVKKTRD